MVGRTVGTIRKCETSGLLPAASRFEYSNNNYRYYTFDDVRNIESFFNSRKVGRPLKDRVYSRKDLSNKLREAKKGIS
jgi:DNA-binding transcriptional MerR regulator